MATENIDLRVLLNAQTGRVEWPELQRHFARGVVLKVAAGLDLVEAAACVVEDSREAVEEWIESGRLIRATDDDAKAWETARPLFWAVVAAPWVLVQEIDE